MKNMVVNSKVSDSKWWPRIPSHFARLVFRALNLPLHYSSEPCAVPLRYPVCLSNSEMVGTYVRHRGKVHSIRAVRLTGRLVSISQI